MNDLVIKAVAYALKTVPEANAYWTEDAIKFHPQIDVSFAAATVLPCLCLHPQPMRMPHRSSCTLHLQPKLGR